MRITMHFVSSINPGLRTTIELSSHMQSHPSNLCPPASVATRSTRHPDVLVSGVWTYARYRNTKSNGADDFILKPSVELLASYIILFNQSKL